MQVRRVVTGQDASGNSKLVSDEHLEGHTARLLPGYALRTVWGDDAAPSLPSVGDEPGPLGYWPPPGGFRLVFSTIPPDGSQPPPDIDVTAGLAELEARFPGMAAQLEDPEPGWHTSDTVDMQMVLSGTLTCELDDGRVTLEAGDFLIQNGTRHRWINPGPGDAFVFTVLVGARRER